MERLAKVEGQLTYVQKEMKLEKERNARINHGAVRRSYESDAVAFYAVIGTAHDHMGPGQTVVFDHVLTNIDSAQSVGGYSATTGVFTAPVSGVYSFSCTIMAYDNSMTHAGFFRSILGKRHTGILGISRRENPHFGKKINRKIGSIGKSYRM
ncbi:uncharacterized protein LOC127856895 [Dreissena polymorpha]|uniref:uncharacterized protein LOC127856895 n=1 Tax=Dreissena polymorpha TaxID=45954 RepID=UPI00226405A0|nr:uncharacterized protein LOC127856895 [Dreissena polymorpha]